MTEEEARRWLTDRNVPRETMLAIELFLELLGREAAVQNLVASSTLASAWSRHIVDSAQLLDHAGAWRSWVDLGSGAGFPGIIIALLSEQPVTLIESRAKRVGFLRMVSAELGLHDHVEIVGSRVEAAPRQTYDVISARAFAPLPKLLELASPFVREETRWLLPKGQGAARELELTRASWHGSFHLVPSVTDADSAIIVAKGVRRRKSDR